MSLDRVFPERSGVPFLELQIGGASLAELLADMMRLIRSQEKEIEALRRDTEDRICSSEWKLQNHEDAIRNISEDLGICGRPISFCRQPRLSTMAAAVTNVESRLAQVEKKGREEIAARLVEIAWKKLAVVFFNRWLRFRKIRAAGRGLLERATKSTWRRYMRKWTRYLALRATQLARQRHLEGLLMTRERRVMMTHWRTWLQRVTARAEICAQRRMCGQKNAEIMLRIISRGIARRFLYVWVKFVETLRKARVRTQKAVVLEQKTLRLLAEHYLKKWFDAHRRLQLQLVRAERLEMMQVSICRSLAYVCFRTWQNFVPKQLERRRVHSLVSYFHHGHLFALARRYFFRFYAFCLVRREARVRGSLERRLNSLDERTVRLQRQLDVGLRTLAHTNSVLARVVDTVMIAEEPRAALRHLLQEETMSPFPLGPPAETADDAQKSPVGPAVSTSVRVGRDRSWAGPEERAASGECGPATAGEILRKLRARLNQTYEVALSEP